MPITPLSAQDSPAFSDAAQVLREVAHHEHGADPQRAAISASMAALVAACGRHVDQLPAEVARQALIVVGAVARAAGRQRWRRGRPIGVDPGQANVGGGKTVSASPQQDALGARRADPAPAGP